MLSKLKRSRLGMIVPVAVVILLAGSMVAAGAASASRSLPHPGGGVQGIVTAVTVGGTLTTTANTCGTAVSPESFTLTGRWHQAVVTVDVGTGTTYSDAALTPPTLATFANICVGGKVTALGTVSSGVLSATLVTIVPAQAQGIVTAVTVGGTLTTTANTCGTAVSPESFTLTGMVPIGILPLPVAAVTPRLVTTVDVTSTTSFTDTALTAPTSATFANVCVGSPVRAVGTFASGALAASAVTILPPIHIVAGHGNH